MIAIWKERNEFWLKMNPKFTAWLQFGGQICSHQSAASIRFPIWIFTLKTNMQVKVIDDQSN